ncbi:MAG TPA: hypothetical protein VM290_09915 [Gaiellaceae bacterium]|nr:hypothetical protein [Gaiellaceae bacterium]
MGIVNRRNAVMGWLAWAAGKRVLRRKAREAVPGFDAETKRPNKGAIVSALAALGGVLWFWRRRGTGDDGAPTPPTPGD